MKPRDCVMYVYFKCFVYLWFINVQKYIVNKILYYIRLLITVYITNTMSLSNRIIFLIKSIVFYKIIFSKEF